MTRQERRQAKHAAGGGKGAPTPRRPPHGRTRAQQTMLEETRRDQIGQLLREGGGNIKKIVERLTEGKAKERAALEKFLRESGGRELHR